MLRGSNYSTVTQTLSLSKNMLRHSRTATKTKSIIKPIHTHLGRYRFLASRFTMYFLCMGTILLVFFDWTFDLGILTFPVSKLLRAFLLIVFAIYLLRTGARLKEFNFPFGHIIEFYTVLLIVHSLVSVDLVGNLYYSTRIIFWLFGMTVAYRLALSNILSVEILHKTIVPTIFIGAAFTIFFMTRPDTEAGQNASAYLLLWCLPLLLLQKRLRIGNVALGLAILAILLTVKRGAMIALCLSLAAYGLTYLKLYGNRRILIKLLKASLLIAPIAIFALIMNWDAIQMRFQDTSGSGRDWIYTSLFNHWIHSEPINIIFGFGVRSVEAYTGYLWGKGFGVSAHSDWLQFMHDFGLLGIGLLLWIHIKFLALIRLGYKMRHPYTPSLVMGYVIMFLVNIYSIHLTGPNAIYFGLLLAYSSANILPPKAHVKLRHPKRAKFRTPSMRRNLKDDMYESENTLQL